MINKVAAFSTFSITRTSADPARIAYIAESRYDLQNTFLSNLFAELEKQEPDFTFELVNY